MGHAKKYVLTTWHEELVEHETAIPGELVSIPSPKTPVSTAFHHVLELSLPKCFDTSRSVPCTHVKDLFLPRQVKIAPEFEVGSLCSKYAGLTGRLTQPYGDGYWGVLFQGAEREVLYLSALLPIQCNRTRQ
jgi:hypothetical protein